jgi:hypothetical protein
LAAYILGDHAIEPPSSSAALVAGRAVLYLMVVTEAILRPRTWLACEFAGGNKKKGGDPHFIFNLIAATAFVKY